MATSSSAASTRRFTRPKSSFAVTCHADGGRPRGTDGGGAERNVGIEDDVAEGRCQGADIVGTIEDMDTIGVGFGGGMSLADVGGVETSKDGVIVETRAT